MPETPLSGDARNHIEKLLAEGRTIEAIMAYREGTGADLLRAKQAIEAIIVELESAEMPSAKPIEPPGCAVVLAALGTTFAATIVFAF